MKKMLLVVSMACATMVANAAFINWSIPVMTIIPGLNEELYGADGAIAYLLVGSSTDGVAAAIENGTFDTIYGSSIKGTPLITMYGGGEADPAGGFDAGTFDLFLVVFGVKNGVTPNLDEYYYMISTVKQGTSYEGTSEGGFVSFNSFSNWAKYDPIPEPATMALVGIGIVTLGLRRRRK